MRKKAQNWWMTLIKGIILILLAIFVFQHPVGMLMGIAVYVGVALLLTGIVIIGGSIMVSKEDDNWGWRLTEGIIDVIFAIIILSNPGITAAIFPFVLGFWIIVYGVMLFSGSFGQKKEGDPNWWTGLLGGILTILFGWFIMTNFFAGSVAITIWIGIALLIFGIFNVSLSFRLKKLNSAIKE